MKRTSFFVLISASALAAWAGCSSDDGSSAAPASAAVSSSSTGGASTSSSTTAATGGGGSATGGGNATGVVALACDTDGDCGQGFTCATADKDDPVFGGGPANGYCTKACAADSDCPSDSVCHVSGGAGVCMASCTWGTPALSAGTLDLNKCHGRDEVSCFLNDDSSGKEIGAICAPTCGTDDECPSGRFCRYSGGANFSVCADAPMPGDPLGSACNATHPMTCAGNCVEIGTVATDSYCSELCVLDGDPGAQCGGMDKGFCTLGIANAKGKSAADGDFGFCVNACMSHEACDTPLMYCLNLDYTPGGVGFCFPPTPCPNGESQCAGDKVDYPSVACQDTPAGKFCIDTAYPLPTGSGGGGGNGGAGGSGGGGATGSGGAADAGIDQ